MRRRSWVAAGLLVAALLGLAAAWAARDDDQSSWTFDRRPDPSLPTAEAPPGEPPAPEIRRQALEIVRRDTLFRRLTRGAEPRLVLADGWSIGEEGLPGAALTFRLGRAVAVDAALPIAEIPPDAPTRGTCAKPYRQTWLHEQSRGVTEVEVLVDVERGIVAHISTNAETGRMSWVDGKPHPSCEAIEAGLGG